MKDSLETDAALVRRLKNAEAADLRAYDVLVKRHQQWVLANCRYMTRSSEAEDIAQEVFIKAYYGLQRFEGRSQFKTWLQRIKVNHCLNFLRGKKRAAAFVDVQDPALEGEQTMRVNPDDTAGEPIGDARLKSVLVSLNETLRVPLVLCDVDGLSYEEIAETLGIGLSATKMRIKRAREEFRERFVKQSAGDQTDPNSTRTRGTSL